MNLYLAPMEGITTYIYRNALHRHYGGADRYYTPFLSNQSPNSRERRDTLPDNNQGIPVVPQILANQADVFLSIAQKLQALGYKEVNLNLGCPSGTVTAKKRGAGFLSVPDRLDAFLEEIFAKCPLAISVKTRVGMESCQEWEGLLSIYKKYPIKELIIHPRCQKELYNGTPHVEAFQLALETYKGSATPLCYNGDITSESRFKALLQKAPSTEAVMVGRGALANPELFRLLRGEPPLPRLEKTAAFRAFHAEILSGYMGFLSGDQPVLFKMKELWGYMGPYAGAADSLLKQLRKSKRISEYKAIVQAILARMSQ